MSAARRDRGEAGQHIKLGQCPAGTLQHRHMRQQSGEQIVVEGFFQSEGAITRRQGLVLEGLEFRRYVALSVLEGLPAAVVVGNLFRLRVGDFDVKAVHPVVFDTKIGNAGALALPQFEFGEKIPRVRLKRAQFVEIVRVAVGDHTALSEQYGRLFEHRALQQIKAWQRHGKVLAKRIEYAGRPRRQ